MRGSIGFDRTAPLGPGEGDVIDDRHPDAGSAPAESVTGKPRWPAEADWIPWLALQRAHAGHPEACATALAEGASPAAILARSGRALPGWREVAERDAVTLRSLGGQLIAWGGVGYPATLAALTDPPPVLLVLGQPESLSRPALAIVGARAATRGALGRTRRMARELAARGLTIVSGLARGVDAEAHRGALEAGGVTVAVLAGGIDRVYPPEHRALAAEIAERGAVVGEMPLRTPPRRELFPLRNRVISGLARGVLVVEARRRSGSLITVRHALAQGREVFVVPGSVDGPFAAGSNRLLRDGARAVSDAAELFADLEADDPMLAARLTSSSSLDIPGVGDPSEDGSGLVDGVTRQVLEALSGGPLDRDALTEAVQADAGRLVAALLDLTLAGRIVEERDGRFHLAFGASAGAG
jgi:DNA processing protein